MKSDDLIKKIIRETKISFENEVIMDPNEWPEEWLSIDYKAYPRFERNQLRKFNNKNSLEEEITKRRSFRNFSKPINYKKLERILYFSNYVKNPGKDARLSRRAYPSAGARYPLEQYIVNLNTKGLEKGIYHYCVLDNSLETISKSDYGKEILKIIASEWIANASFIVVITGIWKRTVVKYGKRSLRYIFYEVGHLAQNMTLIAQSNHVRSCLIGGFDDDKLNKLLRIERTSERALYIIAFGK